MPALLKVCQSWIFQKARTLHLSFLLYFSFYWFLFLTTPLWCYCILFLGSWLEGVKMMTNSFSAPLVYVSSIVHYPTVLGYLFLILLHCRQRIHVKWFLFLNSKLLNNSWHDLSWCVLWWHLRRIFYIIWRDILQERSWLNVRFSLSIFLLVAYLIVLWMTEDGVWIFLTVFVGFYNSSFNPTSFASRDLKLRCLVNKQLGLLGIFGVSTLLSLWNVYHSL